MKRIALPLVILPLLAMAPVERGRVTIGAYGGWAAFADGTRCWAVAGGRGGGERGEAFASVATWPERGLRASLHIRLSRAVKANLPVTLTAGERRFRLVARGRDAFAADAASDRAIAAALRAGRSMSVEGVAANGRPFADSYGLKGAATAIDAATLACAGRR